MTVVENEVAFGLENLGTPPTEIWPRVGAGARGGRCAPSDGGEDGRAVGRGAPARLPRLGAGARATAPAPRRADLAARSRGGGALPRRGRAARRDSRPLGAARRPRARRSRRASCSSRAARLLLDAPKGDALEWLAANRPAYTDENACVPGTRTSVGAAETVVRLRDVSFGYRDRAPVLTDVDLEIRRGEIVVPRGPERLRQDDAREARRRADGAGCRDGRAPRPRLLPLAGSGPLSRSRDGARRGFCRSCRGFCTRARGARALRARLGGAASPARPLERRARAARPRRRRGRPT